MEGSPFVFGKVVGGSEFTNRSAEMTQLQNNFLNGTNTILISPRRWGKSSLVKKAAEQTHRQQNKVVFCFIDLFNIRTEQEFYEAFVKELIKVTSTKWEERLRQAKLFFKQIVPRFSIGIDSTDLDVSIDWKDIKKAPEEILNLAENVCKTKKIRLVVCLDEFQNISFFDQPLAFQKKLRAHWQHHKLTSYCLYGSKRHLLMDIFSSPSMPFYKFGDLVFLEKIKEEHWVSFITKRFKETGKKIESSLAAEIARLVENHPYFVQQLAQQVWLQSKKTVNEKDINNSVETLLLQGSILFQRETDNLTNSQLNYLRALLDEVKQLSSRESLEKYRLGTSANVLRIKSALETKEVIDVAGGKTEFIDPLYKLWLSRVYFK